MTDPAIAGSSLQVLPNHNGFYVVTVRANDYIRQVAAVHGIEVPRSNSSYIYVRACVRGCAWVCVCVCLCGCVLLHVLLPALKLRTRICLGGEQVWWLCHQLEEARLGLWLATRDVLGRLDPASAPCGSGRPRGRAGDDFQALA